ncbi:NAD(P)-dependent oxidoreductase [Streptomyces johnsoniae]|uniref:NAD(P)-dependent oxidoreductase n=1 Tax=Streptomyces johnsoniae TaxID=3075532 RepID=A0ABU2SDW1_9ACTN|nr:NAD(P)-dependent oxidoreductase [Streptomyces sp. DSM 41886]MDT0446988.1 NAD(P)-dependent oxidoreductase [Streptomyces sp. DSM 41886]
MISQATTRIGFAGLGNLGRPMAEALLAAGWHVSLYDRAPGRADALAGPGARPVAEADDLADCGVIALAVPDDAAVGSVLGTLLPRLAEGALVLVHSTVLPATARDLAARAADRGVGLLDAPVSGGAERAARGDLAVMAGGAAEVFERARPVLTAVGSQVRHVGPSGAGSAAKLANQLMMFAALAGAHEALDLAAAYGVAEQDVLAAVSGGLGDSWVARNWGFFDEVAEAYDAGGTPVAERPWSKDLWEVTSAARAAGVAVPVAGLLAQIMADRVEQHARSARRR